MDDCGQRPCDGCETKAGCCHARTCGYGTSHDVDTGNDNCTRCFYYRRDVMGSSVCFLKENYGAVRSNC